MEKERFVFDVSFVALVPAQYECNPKSKIQRLIRRLIDRMNKNYTIEQFSTLPFVLPDYVSIEEFETLLSYYYDQNEEFIKGNPDFEEDEKKELRISFVQNKVHNMLKDYGFKIGGISDEKVSFCFVEKGIYQNEEFEDNFASWYKADVTREEVNSILRKISREKSKTNEKNV